MGTAVLMCERCDAPQGSLDDILDARIYRAKAEDRAMANEQLPLGTAGYWIGIAGLVSLLWIIFSNAVGL